MRGLMMWKSWTVDSSSQQNRVTFVTSFGIPFWAKLDASCHHHRERTIMSTSRYSSQPSSRLPTDQTEVVAGCETVGPAVFCADLHGQFSACSSSFTRLLRYAACDVIGRDFAALFTLGGEITAKDKDQLRKTILSTTLSEGEYRSQLFAQPKSGASFVVEFSATLLRDAASTPAAIVVVVVPAKS